jgi:hypothetical protein
MNTPDPPTAGRHVHVVTLECKDADHARRCLAALAEYGRPDALACHCFSHNCGLKEGTNDTVCLVERWNRWEDLDTLLQTKVVPALPTYNQLLKHPFDPASDTVRITFAEG